MRQLSLIRESPFAPSYDSTLLNLPTQVNYNVQALKIPNFLHPQSPDLQLLGEILANVYYHKEIREKGGAYGGGCRLGDGVLNFYSYRDPNFEKTFESFQNGVFRVSEGKFR